MKNLSLALVASLVVVPSIVLAQGGAAPPRGGAQGGPGMMRGGGFDMKRMKEMRTQRQKELRTRLVKDLKMSADQTKQYDALIKKENAARDKQFEAMTKGGKMPDRDAMRKQMEKSRAEHTASMKKILKADQFTKYEKIVAEMRRARMGGRPQMGGGAGGPKLPGNKGGKG